MSLLGILYLFLKKADDRRSLYYAVFLIFWYGAAIYASTTSVRFIALLVPAFSIAMAGFVALCFDKLPDLGEKYINVKPLFSNILISIILVLVIFVPLAQAANSTALGEVPSMDDAWYTALTRIHDDDTDGIITSWWDFGHWFVAVARRKVTFDGGDQGERPSANAL